MEASDESMFDFSFSLKYDVKSTFVEKSSAVEQFSLHQAQTDGQITLIFSSFTQISADR